MCSTHLVQTKNLYIAAQLAAVKKHKAVAEAAAAKAAHPEVEPEASFLEEEEDELESEAAVVVEEIGEVIEELKSKWRQMVSASSPSSLLPVRAASPAGKSKVPMSPALASLLVYTVGVKCRGITGSEGCAPEHIFSLSENTASKLLKVGAGCMPSTLLALWQAHRLAVSSFAKRPFPTSGI